MPINVGMKGYLIKCQAPGPKRGVTRHALCGDETDYTEFAAPECTSCGHKTSVLFCLDFDDPPLAETRLWDGRFIALTCFNCDAQGDPPLVWWDYTDPNAPKMLDASNLEAVEDEGTWTFEQVPAFITPFTLPIVHPSFHGARIGGFPSDGQAISCIGCDSELQFLAQFTHSFDYSPRAISVSHLVKELDFPRLFSWYQCAECKIVATIAPPDTLG